MSSDGPTYEVSTGYFIQQHADDYGCFANLADAKTEAMEFLRMEIAECKAEISFLEKLDSYKDYQDGRSNLRRQIRAIRHAAKPAS